MVVNFGRNQKSLNNHEFNSNNKHDLEPVAVAGPAAWNALSLETRSATSLEQFKSKLKTELFTISYP